MSYALATIWYERTRFLPAILAVAFSAILIAVQTGLVIGLLSMISLPVDRSTAHVWVGYPGVRSVDLGRPIPDRWLARLAAQPEVVRAEPCQLGFSLWTRIGDKANAAAPEVCTVVGCRLDAGSIGAVEFLRNDPALRERLTEPFTVAVDEAEIGRLNVSGVGDVAEILGRRVKVVGLVRGYRSVGGPYVFCSVETARPLLKYSNVESTYLLASCKNAADAAGVARRLRQYPQMSAYTSSDLSHRSRMHWLTTTKAGVTVGFTGLLGLLVGAVITSQTLYAATAASQREFATLRAMGIPRWRLQLGVMVQSFWVGFFGVLLAAPITFGLAWTANRLGTQVTLHPLVLAVAAGVTMLMALLAGLAALRSFQHVDPAHNIR